MAAVAFGLGFAQRARLYKWVSITLPLTKTAGHRNHVLVAHLLQSTAGHERAHSTGAIKDNRFRLIGNSFFYLQFKKAARNVQRFRDVALVPLVLLTHIYKDDLFTITPGLVLLIQGIMHLGRRPLRHLLARLPHNLAGGFTHIRSAFQDY